jgi:hypothetical protein
MDERVRVLRVIEYIGPREWVEKTVAQSIHGTRRVPTGGEIRAATIGSYPEVLANLPDDARRDFAPYEN